MENAVVTALTLSVRVSSMALILQPCMSSSGLSPVWQDICLIRALQMSACANLLDGLEFKS